MLDRAGCEQMQVDVITEPNLCHQAVSFEWAHKNEDVIFILFPGEPTG